MRKKIIYALMLAAAVPVLTGCVAILAGAGGTALWQAGKVISEETVSMERGANAVESAFKAKKITLEDKVTKNNTVQLRGKDSTGTKVAADVISKGAKNVRLEIRYGIGEETPARELLNEIKRRL